MKIPSEQELAELNFAKGQGLMPAIVQDYASGRVLMLGYMNRDALDKTIAEGRVTFYSRSKGRLWTKGETSGHFLDLREVRVDCDRDTLLLLADPRGPACHTGAGTCFGNETTAFSFLDQLQKVIAQRRDQPVGASYTAALFAAGLDRMAQKVGEEGVEVVIAAKNDDSELLIGEAADLCFHLMVLLQAKGLSLQQVLTVLEQRHRVKR